MPNFSRLRLAAAVIACALATSLFAATPSTVMAPDFEVKDLDGNRIELSKLQGKAVVLNFWATWCGPCRVEIPWLSDLQRIYGPEGLVIVGIALDEAAPTYVTQFMKDMKMNYRVAMVNSSLLRGYGEATGTIPSTFYIGRDGSIVHFARGLLPREQIEAHVREVLATRAK